MIKVCNFSKQFHYLQFNKIAAIQLQHRIIVYNISPKIGINRQRCNTHIYFPARASGIFQKMRSRVYLRTLFWRIHTNDPKGSQGRGGRKVGVREKLSDIHIENLSSTLPWSALTQSLSSSPALGPKGSLSLSKKFRVSIIYLERNFPALPRRGKIRHLLYKVGGVVYICLCGFSLSSQGCSIGLVSRCTRPWVSWLDRNTRPWLWGRSTLQLQQYT